MDILKLSCNWIGTAQETIDFLSDLNSTYKYFLRLFEEITSTNHISNSSFFNRILNPDDYNLGIVFDRYNLDDFADFHFEISKKEFSNLDLEALDDKKRFNIDEDCLHGIAINDSDEDEYCLGFSNNNNSEQSQKMSVYELNILSVQFSSPGFWEFLGKLNIFEVIRQYLNDRHNIKKDYLYRMHNEAHKMAIDNSNSIYNLVSNILDLSDRHNLNGTQKTALLELLVYNPLEKLDKYLDNEMIDSVDIKRMD